MTLILMLWLLSYYSLIALRLLCLWPRKMKIDCSRQTCAGRTHGQTDGHTDTQSDSLSEHMSEPKILEPSGTFREKLKTWEVSFPWNHSLTHMVASRGAFTADLVSPGPSCCSSCRQSPCASQGWCRQWRPCHPWPMRAPVRANWPIRGHS